VASAAQEGFVLFFSRNKPPEAALLAALGAALLAGTWHFYPLTTVALVAASLAQSGASLWSCHVLFGARAARLFLAIGVVLGWCAEQAGATLGWLFGSYHYTEVLGPKLGAVPVVIPLMWFGLAHIGLVLGSLVLWRQPAPPGGEWRRLLLAAFMAALIVTAFDLGADPYFVYQLKAWIMTEKDGDWFGETIRGFEGWMTVSFVIVAAFLAVARPRLAAGEDAIARGAALVPIVLYGGMLLFQVAMVQPTALRVIAFYAMGIPTVIALFAWRHWTPRGAAA
jgi:uncharacterized membrane protein